jgi:hypothetical protein
MLVFTQYIKNFHEIFLIISMEIYTCNAHTHVIILKGQVMQHSILQTVSHEQNLSYLTL